MPVASHNIHKMQFRFNAAELHLCPPGHLEDTRTDPGGDLMEEGLTTAANNAAISAPDTAWMPMACNLVLLMTPTLSRFYGGLRPRRNSGS